MAIRTYIENEKKLYEVYVNGRNSRGARVQRKRNGIETLRKAEQVEFELKRELAVLREEKVPLRFGEWFDECMRQMKIDKRPSTVDNYQSQIRKWVLPHWRDTEMRAITRADVHEMIFEKCAAIRTPNNRKTVLKLVKRLFEMAVDEGVIDRTPCAGIQVKASEVEQKVLTTSEAEKFLREAALADHRFYPMWALALMTGMRSGEMFALRWSDVDLDSRIIHVTRQWTSKNGYGPTKTQKSRIVPISDDLLSFLKGLKLKRGAEESVLPRFPEWENGEQARITREFCQVVGVTPIKFHDLRATFITNLLARGESLARVMSIVGHHQLKTTNGYLRKAGVEVQGGTDKLGYKLPQVGEAQILSLRQRG
ncbi:MAG: site-specific integrase [Bdellovibrionaceae bacterium]|nr:site-specific integrase [Pseudobdellovibrionaceae bacterium]